MVDIIIPLYNKEEFIEDTLHSVNSQLYNDYKCYIIDDGSDDNSINLVKNFIKDKPRFFLIKRNEELSKGAATCRNIGLQNSNQKFIQFLDADDLLAPNKISSQLELLVDENPLTISTCKWGGLLNGKIERYNNLISYKSFYNIPGFLNSLTQSKGYFPIHAYLIPRKLIQKSGLWNEALALNDDGEFIMRILSNTTKVVYSKKGYVLYRGSNGNNLSDFSSLNKTEGALISWILVENMLIEKFDSRVLKFIEFSKGKFFSNVERNYPNLIQENPIFFKKQIADKKKEKSFSHRLRKKLFKLIYG
ncbi:glycosyltransferase family 2 protein [Aequorivita flava]|uniref:Glycosyltransferase family 2 protein n=1 Tax=Aequorivita flava TaxID=3114371 RepID=A0AB35YQI6_9FLAO